ncbi:hypothetical protein [Bacteroides clarus]|uniref:hypothetical protein n=1 Tax=Bacteroides clarus TaxID=626929 RepID=UPI0024B1B3E5|nr:hypothetical protein [Bacteroides clarus]
MKYQAVIHIPSTDLREIKSIVNKFCNNESGKGIKFAIQLRSLENDDHVLVFPKAIPFDLFCELLFKLDLLSDEEQDVRAYLNVEQKESGLPARCMICVSDTGKSDFTAVDSKGNSYEDDAEAEPYHFKPTGKNGQYIPCHEANHTRVRSSYTFLVTEEKVDLLKRICNKVQEVAASFHSCTSGCLPTIILLLIFCYSASLSLRTEDGKLFLYIIIAALVVGLLPIMKNKYANGFATAFFALVILTYIPNYHCPRYMEKRKAVIEEIHIRKGRRDFNSARFRFENNETFKVSYKVNEELMHIGDTCILDMGKGLWGMEICRGVMCNGKQIWGD